MVAVAQVSLLIYAVLLVVGGLVGYIQAQSKVSLIAGLGSGMVASIIYGITLSQPAIGFSLGAILGLILTGVFIMRFRKTQTFMPAGFLSILSVAITVLSGLALIIAAHTSRVVRAATGDL